MGLFLSTFKSSCQNVRKTPSWKYYYYQWLVVATECHPALIFPSENQYFKHFNQIKTFHCPGLLVWCLQSHDRHLPSSPGMLLHQIRILATRWSRPGPGLWLTLYLWTGYLLLITSIIITSQSPLSTDLVNASYKVLFTFIATMVPPTKTLFKFILIYGFIFLSQNFQLTNRKVITAVQAVRNYAWNSPGQTSYRISP